MLKTRFKLNEILVIDCLMIGTLVGVISGSWVVTGVVVLGLVSPRLISRENRMAGDRDQ